MSWDYVEQSVSSLIVDVELHLHYYMTFSGLLFLVCSYVESS